LQEITPYLKVVMADKNLLQSGGHPPDAICLTTLAVLEATATKIVARTKLYNQIHHALQRYS